MLSEASSGNGPAMSGSIRRGDASADLAFSHGSSQPHLSWVLPLNRPKNAACSASVIGPRLPAPTVMRSTERTGVISAAVPVKKSSSARYSNSRGSACSRTSKPCSRASVITVSRVMPWRIECASAGRVDHAVADHEQILARAFAHRAVGAEADAFGEAEALRFHADQLARKVVAAGLGHRGNRVRRHALPRRDADIDAVLQPFGAEIRAPFACRDRPSRPAASIFGATPISP